MSTQAQERDTQSTFFSDIENELALSPMGMAAAMAIPYDSYKDLKSGRRTARPIHYRLIELIKAVEKGGVRAAKAVIKDIRAENPPRAWG